jgi:hypothetical protein
MNILRRLFRSFSRRRWSRARAKYGAEVLFAGWVDLPKALRESRTPRT